MDFVHEAEYFRAGPFFRLTSILLAIVTLLTDAVPDITCSSPQYRHFMKQGAMAQGSPPARGLDRQSSQIHNWF
jgi:hypothetical protein